MLYNTLSGARTFDQIHDQTRGLAAHIMRQEFYLDSYDDIEDSLQFGYWKLWEKLVKDPTWLDGKPDSYIAKSVCFRAKRERQRCIRYTMRNDILPETAHAPGYSRHGHEARQIDRFIDIQLALSAVANFLDNDPLRLFVLYYITTDVTIKDMQTFGLSRHTLRDHARAVRALLKAELRGVA